MKINSAGMKILLVVYIFVLAVIIYIASQKGTRYLLDFVGSIPYGDKSGHFFLMGGFSLLLNLALGARSFRLWRFKYLLGSLIVFLVVTFEEISQIFVDGRTFDRRDLVFDYLGIIVFGELARFICRRKNQA